MYSTGLEVKEPSFYSICKRERKVDPDCTEIMRARADSVRLLSGR